MLKIRMFFFFFPANFVGQNLINKVFVVLGGISMGFLPGLFLQSIHPVRERMGFQEGRKSLRITPIYYRHEVRPVWKGSPQSYPSGDDD